MNSNEELKQALSRRRYRLAPPPGWQQKVISHRRRTLVWRTVAAAAAAVVLVVLLALPRQKPIEQPMIVETETPEIDSIIEQYPPSLALAPVIKYDHEKALQDTTELDIFSDEYIAMMPQEDTPDVSAHIDRLLLADVYHPLPYEPFTPLDL